MSQIAMEKIVLGTAGLAGLWGRVDPDESVRTMLEALEMGIVHFDTAPAYADGEILLAKALRLWKGKKPFVSTKAGKLQTDSPDIVVSDYSAQGLRKSVEDSLRKFGVDALDLVFLHDPTGMQPEEIPVAIEALAGFKKAGYILNMGIGGNYGPECADVLISGGFSHFMGYNRYNIIRQTAVQEEFPGLKKAGLEIWQASPLYMGLLGRKFGEYISGMPEWLPAAYINKAIVLKDACDRSGHDLTGLALNYVYNSPHVDKIVIGSSTLAELRSTMAQLGDPSLRDAALEMLDLHRDQ
jgi:aryl-alcohol dehydrogenase-like predicted oxidoreductase